MDDSAINNLADQLSITDGSGDTLTHALSQFDSDVYAPFSFTLNTSGSWMYTPAGGNSTVPTAAESGVLSNVSVLLIPVDLHNGPENMSLDNVILAASVRSRPLGR